MTHTVVVFSGGQGIVKTTRILSFIPNSLKQYVFSVTINPFNKDTPLQIAECINQLLEKKWSDKDSLYQVGVILSKYTKISKIDWKTTFFVIERTFFIREIQEQEQVEPVKTQRVGDVESHQSQDFFSNLMRAMEIGRETHTVENTKLIKKRVEQNLTKFGIVG